MEIPPWHMGHVVKKLMQAREPALTRTELAQLAGKRPNTITHLLHGGTFEEATLEAVCRVLGCTQADLRHELERSNAWRGGKIVDIHPEPRRRVNDRDPALIDAEQYARRLVRLIPSAQTAIYTLIRAFEELAGYVRRSSGSP